MSQAAEKHAKACTHPQVKGNARDLLDAIARLILEGETTTPAIAIADLAKLTRQHPRTAWNWLEVLRSIGVINVLDGGRGIKARYELVGLDGTRPLATAPLPLVGQTPPRRKPANDSTTPNLFDEPQPLPNVWPYVGNVCKITIRWWAGVLKIFSKVWWWGQTYAKSPYVAPQTYGHTLETPTPHLDLSSSSRSVEVDHTRARGAPEFLTWWIATFAQHPKFRADSAVDRLRDGPLIRDRAHVPPVEVLQPLARLFWDIQSDGVDKSNWDWIAKGNHSITVFHRKIEFLEEERDRLAAAARDTPARDDVWARILKRIAVTVPTYEFRAWFGSSALHDDGGQTITVATDAGDYIQRHYRDVVRAAVEEIRPGATVTFVAVEGTAVRIEFDQFGGLGIATRNAVFLSRCPPTKTSGHCSRRQRTHGRLDDRGRSTAEDLRGGISDGVGCRQRSGVGTGRANQEPIGLHLFSR